MLRRFGLIGALSFGFHTSGLFSFPKARCEGPKRHENAEINRNSTVKDMELRPGTHRNMKH